MALMYLYYSAKRTSEIITKKLVREQIIKSLEKTFCKISTRKITVVSLNIA